jgi:hypothetical protein
MDVILTVGHVTGVRLTGLVSAEQPICSASSSSSATRLRLGFARRPQNQLNHRAQPPPSCCAPSFVPAPPDPVKANPEACIKTFVRRLLACKEGRLNCSFVMRYPYTHPCINQYTERHPYSRC